MTALDLAQRRILDDEAISVVINGASRPSQAVDNAGVSDLPPLGRPLHEQPEAFSKFKVEQQIRGPY